MNSCRPLVLSSCHAGNSQLASHHWFMQVTAVSAKTNTTATSRLGAFTEGNCQVALYDTPGVVHTRYILPCTLVHVACVMSSLQMRTKSLDAVPRYAVTGIEASWLVRCVCAVCSGSHDAICICIGSYVGLAMQRVCVQLGEQPAIASC